MNLNYREKLGLAITALIASTVTLVIAILVFYVPSIASPINVGHYYASTPEEVQIENQLNAFNQEFNIDISAYSLGFSDQADSTAISDDDIDTQSISVPSNTDISIDEVNDLYN